jgi:hypothetical protein
MLHLTADDEAHRMPLYICAKTELRSSGHCVNGHTVAAAVSRNPDADNAILSEQAIGPPPLQVPYGLGVRS